MIRSTSGNFAANSTALEFGKTKKADQKPGLMQKLGATATLLGALGSPAAAQADTFGCGQCSNELEDFYGYVNKQGHWINAGPTALTKACAKDGGIPVYGDYSEEVAGKGSPLSMFNTTVIAPNENLTTKLNTPKVQKGNAKFVITENDPTQYMNHWNLKEFARFVVDNPNDDYQAERAALAFERDLGNMETAKVTLKKPIVLRDENGDPRQVLEEYRVIHKGPHKGGNIGQGTFYQENLKAPSGIFSNGKFQSILTSNTLPFKQGEKKTIWLDPQGNKAPGKAATTLKDRGIFLLLDPRYTKFIAQGEQTMGDDRFGTKAQKKYPITSLFQDLNWGNQSVLCFKGDPSFKEKFAVQQGKTRNWLLNPKTKP
jgi:hypothetical protein